MSTKIRLYIGADNKTNKITKEYEEKVGKIISKYWDNFTLTRKTGYYEGKVEDSIEAVIIVLKLIFKDLDDCVNELKVKLVQKEIGLEIEVNVDFKLI